MSEDSITAEADDRPHHRSHASLRRAAIRGGTAVLGSRVLIQLLTTGVTFLVTRILRPYDYGVITANSFFLNLADTLAVAGLGMALVQKPEISQEEEAEVFTLNLVLSTLVSVFLFAAAGPMANYFAIPELRTVLPVSAVVLLITPLRTVPMALLERRVQMTRHSAITTISAIVQSGVTLLAAILGFGYWSLVASFCVARGLETWIFARQAGWRPRLRYPSPSSRGLIRFGLGAMGSSLLWLAYSQTDYAIAARTVGPVELGYYGVAFQLVTLPTNRLAAGFGQVAYSVFCRIQDQPDRLRDWYLRLMAIIGGIGLPLFVGIALVGDDGVAVVLGSRWIPAATPIRVLCLPAYALFLNATLHPILFAMGRPDLPVKYNATFASLMLPAFLVLGTRHGLIGLCLAWALFYPPIVLALVHLSRTILGFGVGDLLRSQLPALTASMIMTLIVVAVRFVLFGPDHVAWRLFASIALGASTYALSIWVIARRSIFSDVRIMLGELKRP